MPRRNLTTGRDRGARLTQEQIAGGAHLVDLDVADHHVVAAEGSSTRSHPSLPLRVRMRDDLTLYADGNRL